jgi:hypothetical protein
MALCPGTADDAMAPCPLQHRVSPRSQGDEVPLQFGRLGRVAVADAGFQLVEPLGRASRLEPGHDIFSSKMV